MVVTVAITVAATIMLKAVLIIPVSNITNMHALVLLGEMRPRSVPLE